MRQFVIKFEEDKEAETVRCITDFGDREKATKAENELADEMHFLIHMSALIIRPRDIVAMAHGATQEECRAKINIDKDIREAGG